MDLENIQTKLHALPLNKLYKEYWLGQLNKYKENSAKYSEVIAKLKDYLEICNLKEQIYRDTQVSYPDNLPVTQALESLETAIANHQVIVVCGETGSGKTTQLPKLLYAMGYANYATIAHTQPRRVAAKTLAKRIGEELNNTDLVGFKVRFQDKTKPTTAIKLMTDGVLLQEIKSDKYLFQYNAIIIDEAHERSLNIDFILGYLKTILPKRPDLKVIITSATIDNNKLANFFNKAPIINIPGKTYPVDIIYQPLQENTELNVAIFQVIESCFNIERGNVLVFLPGEREIKECISFLRKTTLQRYAILPLFARQNEFEQALVFKDDGKLKIIVTTNVAETSLTIPGVLFVIDSGIARVKRYNVRNKVEQLLVEKIAKANSLQRTGRAGRISHGMCVRLFGEDDFNLRPEFADPEIIRSNLANVILKLIGLNLSDPLDFPFLDAPDKIAFNDGYKTLYQIQAIDESNKITKFGYEISLLPVDVNLASMLIVSGKKYNALKEVLVIVSFLAIIDPREYPLEWQQKARDSHQKWADKNSDFSLILNLWAWYHEELAHKKSYKKLLQNCNENFVSLARLRQWYELHGQLKEVMHNLGYKESEEAASYEAIHKSLLVGLLNNIGKKDIIENSYVGANGKKFLMHPSSAIVKPKWVCSFQLVQTTQLYARTNAYIEPKWLVPLTLHLVKYSYSNEFWSKARGEVIAEASTLLYGLVIDKNKVSCSKYNPVLARELFIKQGLVENNLGKNYKFIEHNLQVIKNIEKLEHKLRHFLLIIEDELFSFYDARLAANIYDIRSLDNWLKTNPNRLEINESELLARFSQDSAQVSLYPDKLIHQGEPIRLKYIFDPAREDDGVTATLKLSRINTINSEIFSWLVPGLIREKVSAIIKGLSKEVRLQLNPLSQFITEFLQACTMACDFASTLSKYILETKRLHVPPQAIMQVKLPRHLIFHFQVMDESHAKNATIIATGDDFASLKSQLQPRLKEEISKLALDFTKHNITNWQLELAQLLEPIKISSKNQVLTGYKALVLDKEQVNLIIQTEESKALKSTKAALQHLVKLQITPQVRYLEQKQFTNFKTCSLYLADIYSANELLVDCINYIFYLSFELRTIIPKSEAGFINLVTQVKSNLANNTAKFAKLLLSIATLYQEIKLQLEKYAHLPLYESILNQLDDLIYPRFLRQIKFVHLENYPRYLEAILRRIAKYRKSPSRDAELEMAVIKLYNTWYQHLDELEDSQCEINPKLYDFKFALEELRVSFFAEELKTKYPVSVKRLTAELEQLF
jgi:ATP-dependent helicase HrpA